MALETGGELIIKLVRHGDSVTNVARASRRSSPAALWPEQPYPGARPDTSYVLAGDRLVHGVADSPAAPSGFAVGDTCLDEWLAAHDAPPLAQRIPVLAYGSNANPMKLLAMASFGLHPPVVLLRCRTRHLAAVWCAGRRRRDGLPPATITSARGRTEVHFVTMCTTAQLAAFDRCEGHGERYDRVPLPDPAHVRIGRRLLPHVLAYVGIAPHRAPLLDPEGRHLPITEVPRARATRLLSERAQDAEARSATRR